MNFKRSLASRLYKGLLYSIIQIQASSSPSAFCPMEKSLNRYFIKEDIGIANKHMEKLLYTISYQQKAN